MVGFIFILLVGIDFSIKDNEHVVYVNSVVFGRWLS